MALNYTPRGYMWIATYRNGQAVPQFDPLTGKENKFKNIEKSDVERIGLFPISPTMTVKILEGEGVLTVPNENPIHEVLIPQGKEPDFWARTICPSGQFHECLECGYKWLFAFGKEDPVLTRKGYPKHRDHKIYCVSCASEGKNTELIRERRKWRCPKVDEHRNPAPIRRYGVAVCPGCGYHNVPTDTKEEHRIVQKVVDMSYLVYLIGPKDEKLTYINEWGEVIGKGVV